MKYLIKIIILFYFGVNQIFAQSISSCSGGFQGSPPPAIFSIASGNCNFGQSIQLSTTYYGTWNHRWSIGGGNGGAYFLSNSPMNSPTPPCIVITSQGTYQVTHSCDYTNSSGANANSSYTCSFTIGNYNPVINYMSDLPSDQLGHSTNPLNPVGTIQGGAEVSLNGAATYSIPISTPSGVGGIEPSVAVSYNSLGGNGLLGLGWNLAAGSSIVRTNHDLYHDSEADAPTLSSNDALALDGNRLILEAGEYRTKTESFSKITVVPFAGGFGFKVEGKNGIVMEYGLTDDSRFGNTNSNAVIWQLNKTIDKFGNYVEYKYININKTIYLDEIKYTGNTTANILPSNSIKFEYKMRDDANIGFIAGVPINANLLLTKITVKAENQLYSTYNFVYVKDKVQSFLKAVSIGGSNGELLRPTYFKYADNDWPPVRDDKTVQGPFLSQGGIATEQKTGDFNGDGRTDILSIDYNNTPANPNCERFVTQIDGVRKTPVLLPQNSIMGYNSEYANNDQINFLAQDYNGDTYDDVPIIKSSVVTIGEFVLTYNGPSEFGDWEWVSTDYISLENVLIYHSKGDGDFNPPKVYSLNPISNNYVNKVIFVTGDFNADGLVDYLTAISDGNYYSAFLSFPNTDPSLSVLNQRIVDNTGNFWHIGAELFSADFVKSMDYDGDGKADLIIKKNGNVKILNISKGNTAGQYLATPKAYLTLQASQGIVSFGDFNGDRKTDLLLVEKTPTSTVGSFNNNYSAVVSDGLYGFTPISFSYARAGALTPTINIADFDGNGLADIAFADIVLNPQSNTESHAFKIYYSKGNSFASDQMIFPLVHKALNK
jgi:hypothetical protein